MLFDAPPGIAQEDVVAFFTAQQRLIGLLHARLAHIVAAPVFGMVFQVGGIDFRNVTEQVAATHAGIGTGGAPHARKTGEQVVLFDKHVVLLTGHLAAEHQGLETDARAVPTVLPELFVDESGVETGIKRGNGLSQILLRKVEADSVTIDTNHPMAGKTLIFSGEVLENRPATNDEVNMLIKHLTGGCSGCGGCGGDGDYGEGCGEGGCGHCHG